MLKIKKENQTSKTKKKESTGCVQNLLKDKIKSQKQIIKSNFQEICLNSCRFPRDSSISKNFDDFCPKKKKKDTLQEEASGILMAAGQQQGLLMGRFRRPLRGRPVRKLCWMF